MWIWAEAEAGGAICTCEVLVLSFKLVQAPGNALSSREWLIRLDKAKKLFWEEQLETPILMRP